MSKFEWSFITDYALENKLTVEQVVNKARKGQLRLCGILDETNYPGGYLKYCLHRAISDFSFDSPKRQEHVGTEKQNSYFIFDNYESVQGPFHLDLNEVPSDPESLIIYADIGGRYFLKLDQISLLALLTTQVCTAPTVNRKRFEELRDKKDLRAFSIEIDLNNVVVIITDKLDEEERFPTRTKNNYLKVMGGLAIISEDLLNLKKVGLLANKDKQGAANIISEKLSHMDAPVSEQTVSKYLKESFDLIGYEYTKGK